MKWLFKLLDDEDLVLTIVLSVFASAYVTLTALYFWASITKL